MENLTNIKKRIVCFDFETDGLSFTENRPIELAAKSIELDGSSKEISLLIKSRKPLSKTIVDLTGITDEELESNGIEYEDAMSQLCDFMELSKNTESDTYITGHNMLKFDIKFLEQFTEPKSIKLNKPRQRWDTAGYYKAKKLNLAMIDGESIPDYHLRALFTRAKGLYFKLAICCEESGVKLSNAHRAMGDVEATLELFKKQINEFIIERSLKC